MAEQGQASTAPQMAEPVATSETPGETRGPLEVDLTCDIDALEEPEAETAVDAAPPEEDVYELNASPALHDLESALEAAAPPAAFVPNPLHEIAPAEPAPVEAHPAVNKEKPEKSRKRSDKKGPKKPSKSSTTASSGRVGIVRSRPLRICGRCSETERSHRRRRSEGDPDVRPSHLLQVRHEITFAAPAPAGAVAQADTRSSRY